MSPSQEQRIREKLGPTVGIAYIENILAKPPLQIMEWMERDMKVLLSQLLVETRVHLDQDLPDREVVNLGLNILLGRLQIYAFVTRDLIENNNAITT